jgi:hypothetical protein
MFKKTIFIVISLSFALAACSPSTPTADTMMKESATPGAMMEKTSETMMEESATPDAMIQKTNDTMMDVSATPDAMMQTTEDTMMEASATPGAMGSEMMDDPAWLSVKLTNVSSGETFSIGDLKGKVVLVEPMAAWCSNCLKQQTQLKQLDEMLGMPADLVKVGLAIDPNEDAKIIKTYIENKGFDWTFAVSPAEVSSELSNLYGDQFLNPTSVPMLLIDRSGKVTVLPFGIKSAEDLKKQIEPLLSAGM